MSLRQKLIKAGAQEMRCDEPLGDAEFCPACGSEVEEILDAILDVLGESQLEWKREAAWWWSLQDEAAERSFVDVSGLIGALRT